MPLTPADVQSVLRPDAAAGQTDGIDPNKTGGFTGGQLAPVIAPEPTPANTEG
jgi:hypothetical protein